MTGRTARRRIMHIDVSAPGAGETLLAHRPDLLAAEDPLEIRVDGRPLAVTMRTPGDDIDLAAGFLAGEGLVRSACDIASIRICRESHDHHVGTSAGRGGKPRRRPGQRRGGDPGRRRADRRRPGAPQLPHHERVRGMREGQHRGDQGAGALRRGRRPGPRRPPRAHPAARQAARRAARVRPHRRAARRRRVRRRRHAARAARGRGPAQRGGQGGRLGAARGQAAAGRAASCW